MCRLIAFAEAASTLAATIDNCDLLCRLIAFAEAASTRAAVIYLNLAGRCRLIAFAEAASTTCCAFWNGRF